jgi:hypothetical protein
MEFLKKNPMIWFWLSLGLGIYGIIMAMSITVPGFPTAISLIYYMPDDLLGYFDVIYLLLGIITSLLSLLENKHIGIRLLSLLSITCFSFVLYLVIAIPGSTD